MPHSPLYRRSLAFLLLSVAVLLPPGCDLLEPADEPSTVFGFWDNLTCAG